MYSNNNKRYSKHNATKTPQQIDLSAIVSELKQLNTVASQNANNKQLQVSPKQERNNNEKPKWTEKGGFWVSVVVGIFTLALFGIATWQAKISNDAVSEAHTANLKADTARWFNDSVSKENLRLAKEMFNAQKESSIFSDSVSRANLVLSKVGLKAQLESLKKNQERFEKENKPYLDILHVSLKIDSSTGKSYIIQDVYNVGRQPIKLLEYDAIMSVFEDPQNIDSTDSIIMSLRFPTNTIMSPLPTYVGSQSFRQFYAEFQQSMWLADIAKIKNGDKVAAVLEKIRYINLITNRIAYCEIKVAVNIYPNTEMRVVYENNYDEEK